MPNSDLAAARRHQREIVPRPPTAPDAPQTTDTPIQAGPATMVTNASRKPSLAILLKSVEAGATLLCHARKPTMTANWTMNHAQTPAAPQTIDSRSTISIPGQSSRNIAWRRRGRILVPTLGSVPTLNSPCSPEASARRCQQRQN